MGLREKSAEASGEASGGRAWRFVDTLLLAVALGLMFGLGEALALGWRAAVRGEVTHITPQVGWMAPAAYAGLFLLLSPLARLLGAHRRARGPAAPVCLFVTLGLVGWLEMAPWTLHAAAVWGLAVAAALRLAIVSTSRRRALARWIPLAVPILAVGIALMAWWLPSRISPHPIGSSEGSAARAAVDGVTPAGKPNVLLLILDTVRAKSLGSWGGNPELTPRIDALADEAIVFGRAISTAPWTLPSHASMFTGRWPHELSVGWDEPLDDADATLAEVLSRGGYATSGFVANLAYGARQFGLSRGFEHYEDFPITVGQTVLAASLGRTIATTDWLRNVLGSHELLNRKTAAHVRRDFLAWLDRGVEKPFFSFVNFYDAHEPYEPPARFRERFAPGVRREGVRHRHNLLRGVNARREESWGMSPADADGERALYEAAIASLDSEIGEIIDALVERQLLDNTVLIVTSDHGEQIGEHGMFGHWQSLYQPATHVPLMIRLPGGERGGTRVTTPVSLVDLPATVLDLVGASHEDFPGNSLRSAWTAEVGQPIRISPAMSQLARGLVEQPWYPVATGFEMQSFVTDPYHYICNPNGTEELYDLSRDPEELNNLVQHADAAPTVSSLRQLAAYIGAPPPQCPPPSSDPPRLPLDRR